MSTSPEQSQGQRPLPARERRKVVFATVVGTTVEWYDYFIFAAAAALVFGDLFFAGFGDSKTILSYLTMGVSFLFRPVGAFLAGHLGDRYGRRMVLTVTLVMMGIATVAIGLLPTYASIGWIAPLALIVLRIVQGVSAGGEWGGAVLMAVEHAPNGRRGAYGASPQIGVPLGLLLASGVMAFMAVVAPGDAFMQWGWRVPFLLSFALIAVGYFVRRSVEESPVFAEIAQRREQTRTPILVLLRNRLPLVVIAALVFAGNNAVGYMTTGGYIQGYATDPEGPIGLSRGPVLWVVAASGAIWLLSTLTSGVLSDRLGRRNTYLLGWVFQLIGVAALFPLVNGATLGSLFAALGLLAIGLGFTYGPQAAFYSELFPASIRFSGVSISYALGSILGGAFAPTIAQALVQRTGGTGAVTIYLATMTIVGLLATLMLRDRSGIPLGPDHEAEQAVTPLRGMARV